jgi:hypothetical protein
MLRDGDFAVRLGGDEFVIVQTAVGHSREASLLARRAIAVLNEPFAIDGNEIEIGASIGIAVGREIGDLETLMSAADKALYKSKSNGRNRASFAHLSEATLPLTGWPGEGAHLRPPAFLFPRLALARAQLDCLRSEHSCPRGCGRRLLGSSRSLHAPWLCFTAQNRTSRPYFITSFFEVYIVICFARYWLASDVSRMGRFSHESPIHSDQFRKGGLAL